jgi:SAM-dependent methyltransferase
MNKKIYNRLNEMLPCSNKELSQEFGCDIDQTNKSVSELTHEINERIMHKYFSEIWQPRLKKFKYSGLKLIDNVNNLQPRAVLDVGCGYNEFKGKIKNLIGIDPYNKHADIQVGISEYTTVDKFDVILCLGSINFGDDAKIYKETKKCADLLAPDGKMFFRVNPGKPHDNKESEYIEFYPWNVYNITELAKKLNLAVLDLRHDWNDRIYFVLGKS